MDTNPISNLAREAGQLIANEHEKHLYSLLEKHDLWKEGEQLDDKILASKGYALTQFMLPDHTYRISLAKIVESVEYKAEVKFNLEAKDMPDTTFEDTEELRAKRAEAASVEPEAVTEDEKPTADESSEANE